MQGLPEALKQKIMHAAAGGGLQIGLPHGGGLPGAARAALTVLFKSWFTNAVAGTFVVAVALALIGGLCALLLRSHVASADNAETRDGVTTTVAEP